ncbi:MAG: hypothetical protein JO185_26860 [Acidobacteriaceae bacterium]|nr:hypothetical protein [Acidobacteriaceae bacterium]
MPTPGLVSRIVKPEAHCLSRYGFTILLGRVGSLSRWGWEALVLEAVREGLLSRGQAGELLGLGFHEREAFLPNAD